MDYNWTLWLNMSQMTRTNFLPKCNKSLSSLIKEEVQIPFSRTLETSLDDRVVRVVVMIVASIHGIQLIDEELI